MPIENGDSTANAYQLTEFLTKTVVQAFLINFGNGQMAFCESCSYTSKIIPLVKICVL